MNERVSSMEDIIISPRTRLPIWSSKYIPSIMVGIGIASFLSLYLIDNHNNNSYNHKILENRNFTNHKKINYKWVKEISKKLKMKILTNYLSQELPL